jgi:thiamine biosynthesis lipoprotein
MLHTALRMGDTCGGMFDITVYPLKRLWGLGEEDTGSVHTRPSSDNVADALTHINYRALHIDTQNALVLYDDPAVTIDAGGIAKGFALMRIALMLDSIGFTDFLVNGGGDVIGRGHRRDGTPWRIAIKHPRASDRLLGAFRLDSGNVFTSGDYERFWFDSTGRRIHHIFNPQTGYSATANQSVTIWSMDPIICKFYSTGLFSLPADSIIAFVKQRPGVECLVVDSAGSVFISEGWKDKVKLYPHP